MQFEHLQVKITAQAQRVLRSNLTIVAAEMQALRREVHMHVSDKRELREKIHNQQSVILFLVVMLCGFLLEKACATEESSREKEDVPACFASPP